MSRSMGGSALGEQTVPHSRPALLGIDIGGSGSRIALIGPDGGPRREVSGPRVSIGSQGSSVPQLVGELLKQAGRTWPEAMADGVQTLDGVGVGATGLASLVADPDDLVTEVARQTGAPAVLAIDAVAAHLGALDGAGGAVVALGTGAIAVGHPGAGRDGRLPPQWRRVDGWGHLLGDRGGGAWLGRCGLELALRSFDGLDAAGDALLLAGRTRFGEPHTWPGQLYTRADRAGVLAEFARDVVQVAHAGDQAAQELLARAGREAAASAAAALDQAEEGATGDQDAAAVRPTGPASAVITGGLAAASSQVVEAFAQEVASRRPDVAVVEARGEPLEGALLLARAAVEGRAEAQEGFLWKS